MVMERRHKEIAPEAAPTPDTPSQAEQPNLEENLEEADENQPPMQQVTDVDQNNAGPKKTPDTTPQAEQTDLDESLKEADASKQPLDQTVPLDLSIGNVDKNNAGPKKTPDTTPQAEQQFPLDLSSGKK
jgi:hypothetical protein